MDLIENLGKNFCYKRWSPLCLSGTQLRLLPESGSPGLQLPFAQINAFYPLLQSKINFGLHSYGEKTRQVKGPFPAHPLSPLSPQQT